MPKKRTPKKKVQTYTRKRDKGIVRFVGAEIAPALDDALEECARHEERTKKVLITKALQQYLERAGLWPPSPRPE